MIRHFMELIDHDQDTRHTIRPVLFAVLFQRCYLSKRLLTPFHFLMDPLNEAERVFHASGNAHEFDVWGCIFCIALKFVQLIISQPQLYICRLIIHYHAVDDSMQQSRFAATGRASQKCMCTIRTANIDVSHFALLIDTDRHFDLSRTIAGAPSLFQIDTLLQRSFHVKIGFEALPDFIQIGLVSGCSAIGAEAEMHPAQLFFTGFSKRGSAQIREPLITFSFAATGFQPIRHLILKAEFRFRQSFIFCPSRYQYHADAASPGVQNQTFQRLHLVIVQIVHIVHDHNALRYDFLPFLHHAIAHALRIVGEQIFLAADQSADFAHPLFQLFEQVRRLRRGRSDLEHLISMIADPIVQDIRTIVDHTFQTAEFFQ